MRHLFIINPVAGKNKSRRHLMCALDALSFEHEVAVTQRPGDARHIARNAAETGRQLRIYACGGDGTLNEVINGAAGFDNVAVTSVPTGTGNDFLKLFGSNWRDLFFDLEALAQGPESAFDLIDCNGTLGIDVVCVGLDARIAADVHRYKRLPLIGGMGAYTLSLAANVLFKGISQPMEVTVGERTHRGKGTLLCVCNGRYYGGGFMPVPEAVPDDGVLNTLYVPKVGLFTFVKLVGKYAKGRYREVPELVSSYCLPYIHITSPDTLVAALDGEILRDTEFTIQLSEKKVRFFYPATARYDTPN